MATTARPTATARALVALSVGLTVLGLATARVIVEGERELARSNAALAAREPLDAIVHARRAAGWYAPGAPHVSVAYDRLLALAEAAEASRRPELALLAWRSIRQASSTTRWVVAPHRAQRQRAEREIARLSALQPRQAAPDEEVLAARLAELTHRPSRRHPAWSVALVASFALAAAGFAVGSRRVAGAGGRLDWRAARGGLVLTALGAAGWLVVVWRG
ncbi:MAG: hypothetical protein AAF928_11990 [Myxococcota bacterium]